VVLAIPERRDCGGERCSWRFAMPPVMPWLTTLLRSLGKTFLIPLEIYFAHSSRIWNRKCT
jgi:hypothetical protein